MKRLKHVNDFKAYYGRLGIPCKDDSALQTRLRQAITNSKEKKYHGSSEHMNELPEIEDQGREMLLASPSPFDSYDEGSKTFKAGGADAIWRSNCMDKFPRLRQLVESNFEKLNPA